MRIDLKDKKVSIIGAARSGIATAIAVLNNGGIPFVSDMKQKLDDRTLKILSDNNIEFELGGHTDKIYDAEIMIVSPAIPSDSEIIKNAKSQNIKVWPEVELAYLLCKGKIIAVTGSNGKTTTTALIGEILKNAGYEVHVCGNIGRAFIGEIDKITPNGWAVVELSSFQLEQIDQLRPDIAVVLNITPDHLDRHGTLENYTDAKLRIFENQSSDDTAVVNYDDPILKDKCDSLTANTDWFSYKTNLDNGVSVSSKEMLEIDNTDVMEINATGIKGDHNLSNSCAAAAACKAAGVNIDKIADGLKKFAGVEHRLEFVRLIGGVSFINDSKGTNVDSVFWALKTVTAPAILIAGGRDKAGDFTVLNDFIREKIKTAILIGEASEKIESTWKDITTCIRAKSMEEAVHKSFEIAGDGYSVLLSPGCASFDMFKSYEHRGEEFKRIVNSLTIPKVAQ